MGKLHLQGGESISPCMASPYSPIDGGVGWAVPTAVLHIASEGGHGPPYRSPSSRG